MNKLSILILFSVLCKIAFSQDYTYDRALAVFNYGYYDSVSFIIGESKENTHLEILGKAYFKLGELNLAKQCFKESNTSESAYMLATTYSIEKQYDSAYMYLTLHLNYKSKHSYNYIMTDTLLENLYTTVEWKNLWRQNWYTDNEMEFEQIEYLLNTNEFIKAKAILESKSQLNNEEKIQLSYIYLKEGKQIDSRKLIEQINGVNSLNDRYMMVLFNLGLFGECDAYLRNILHSRKYDMSIYYELAKNQFYQKKYNEAIESIKKYTSIYYQESEAYYLESICKSELKLYNEALLSINKAIQYNSRVYKYLYERANIYMEIQQFYFAELDYTQCLDLNPQIEIYFNRGQARKNQGKINEACLDYSRSVKLGNSEALYFVNKYCK